MGAVVLDASVLLGLFDPQDIHHDAAVTAVSERRVTGSALVVPASALSEVLVGAARRSEDELAHRRRQLTAAFGQAWPLDEPVAVEAARLRARHRALRLPDALVLATAQVLAADAVLTADRRWSHYSPRVQVIE